MIFHSSSRLTFCAFLWILSAFALSLCETRAESEPVKVKLISNISSIKPGENFLIGAYFEISPSWHIYWKNPGDAGLPTQVKTSLPEGFNADQIHWPAPSSFNQGSGLLGYGYEKDVLLFQEVTPPAALEYGNTVHISADVKWVGCSGVCVPGKKSLKLLLPVSGTTSLSLDNDYFQKWIPKVPSSGGPNCSFEYNFKGSLPKIGEIEQWQLSIEWPTAPSSFSWYPYTAAPFQIKEVVTENKGNAAFISFRLGRKDSPQQPTPPLIDSILSFSKPGQEVQSCVVQMNGESNGSTSLSTSSKLSKQAN